MIQKKAIYKCEVCGNIVESLWNGRPDVVCCGRSMIQLTPNTVDAAKEKHVPVIERNGNVVKVKIGSVAHPMTKEHYILFVELLAGNDVYRHDFKEGDLVAEATFMVDPAIPVTAREFCNLHGLWSNG